jgi:hypothetical protein
VLHGGRGQSIRSVRVLDVRRADAAPRTPSRPTFTLDDLQLPRRKTSRRARDADRLLRNVVRGSERVARAVQRGLSKYEERAEASARTKRDGALRDARKNVRRGLRKTFRGLPPPGELLRGIRLGRLSAAGIRALARRLPRGLR